MSTPLLLVLKKRRQNLLLDTFTRGDNALALGAADSGQSPTPVGVWGISSNEAYCVSDVSGNLATWDAVVGNGELRARVKGQLVTSGLSARRVPALALRYTSALVHLRVLLVDDVVSLRKLDTTETVIASAAVTTVDDQWYLVSVRCHGPSITVSVDGVQLFSHTLTGGDEALYPASATRVGLVLSKLGIPTVAARWDDLSFARVS